MRRLLCILALLLPWQAFAEVEVETARIAHGVHAWYANSGAVPVVHVILSFEGAGSVSDPAGKAGRAAIAASMLTEGAGDYDSLGFQSALEDKAIQLSIDSSDDRLTIHIHALRDQAVAAGRLVALALAQPRFAENDLARVKTQTLSLLSRLEESPSYQASHRFEEAAFAGHPYASPHYGTPESLAAINSQDLRDYLATYVGRGNLLIAASGDVDRSLLDDMLEPIIDALGTSDVGSMQISKVSMRGGGTSLQVPMAVPQSYVLFAAPGMARADPRFYAYYLLNEVLGGNVLTSRLADGVRLKKGLVYSIDSALEQRAGVALLRGSLASRAEKAAEAVATVKTILGDLAQRGVTAGECEDARTHVLGSFPLQLDSSRDIAEVILMMRIYDLGEDYLKEREKKFRTVRCEDVSQLARDYLAPEKFLFVTAGSP